MAGLNKSLVQDVSILFGIVADVTGITEDQINNRSRKRDITDARMMICETLRQNSKYPLDQIGSVIGGLNHSSIVYYRTKLNDICEVDKEFKRKFIEIDSRFKEIKIHGLPLDIQLNNAIEERSRLNKEIQIMKKSQAKIKLISSMNELDLDNELGKWEHVQYRIREENMEYCFRKYSKFEEIEDKEFHELRLLLISTMDKMDKLVQNRMDDLNELINDF